ncbi:filamentous hemagglutinin N-terminal domain-containing protein [Rhodopseudomonas sp. P2A-2r]|uniref:two-partner secretion domain-containing protein n=1 Tax=Rhodopseudomonas sp. P2A-2r TaxID=2991972 RepID=UPI00223483D0|nr:filamentous hemagglutinin N-terminal domain-containing protein [Rhodopseudomonas sp. P2A-2r]UZE50956.1 filamentous hemagglutinin N-terminal domain-containing protein [Rhodopseudomonas sp. P2A-2r]
MSDGLLRHSAVLMVGASALAMLAASPEVHARALNGGGSAGAVSAPNLASDAAAQAAQQAAAAVQQTRDSLARAARAVQDMQGIQAAARSAAAAQQTSLIAPVAVPNGVGAGGLLPNNPATWSGANAPTQGTDGAGQTQVNIRQTTQQAILNWTSFNVGARTTLTFDQQGNGNWVALNRVDASTGPSQILGNIKADGQVYVINQSGIIFGGNSQVNVGSLIASTADLSDTQFRTNGIYSTQTNNIYAPSFTAAGGKVVVEAGASIVTSAPASVTSGGGYVLLIGSEVSNAGGITTPKGQAILAAGDNFILRKGFGTDANQFSTTNGSEIVPVIQPRSSAGRVTNTGIVLSQQGDITLAGRGVTQDGVLLSTTSVNQRGTIHLLNAASDAGGSVTMTGKSLSWIVPELESKDAALNAQRDGLIAASGPNDRRDQSRVEIVTGGWSTSRTARSPWRKAVRSPSAPARASSPEPVRSSMSPACRAWCGRCRTTRCWSTSRAMNSGTRQSIATAAPWSTRMSGSTSAISLSCPRAPAAIPVNATTPKADCSKSAAISPTPPTPSANGRRSAAPSRWQRRKSSRSRAQSSTLPADRSAMTAVPSIRPG